MSIQDNSNQGAMAAALSGINRDGDRRQEGESRTERQDAPRQERQERDTSSNQFFTGARGFAGQRAFVAPPTAYRSNNDLSGKIRQELEKLLAKASNDPNYQVDLHHIPKGEPFGDNVALSLAAVIVVIRPKTSLDAAAAYFTLIVEGSGEGFKTQHLNVPGAAPIDVAITPDMIFDENFESAVAAFIERRYPNVPAGMQISAQGMVLPRTQDVNEETLEGPFNEALAAASSTLVMVASGEEDYSLPDQSDQRQVIVQERFNMIASSTLDGEILDATGRPRRIDVRLDLKTGRPYQDNRYSQQQSMSFNTEQQTLLGWMGAALEFFHVPLPQGSYYQQSPYQFQQDGDSRIAQFYARYVITWLQTPEIPTLSRLLFILAMADSLRVPMNWYSMIRSTMRSQDAVAARNIGLLGLIAQGYPDAGCELGLPTTNEDESKLQQWVSEVFHKNPIISMDIDLCGPNSWFLRDFSDAAKLADGYSDLAAAANDKVLGAAMMLTNGAIADLGFAPGSQPVCFPEATLIPAGTIQTNNGLRDVRNVDLLNLLGTPDARRDPSLAMRFNDTFFPDHASQRERCHATRLQLIKQFYPSFKHTGWHVRVTLAPHFISALAEAISRNNVSITQTDDADAYQGWADKQYRYADQYQGRYQASGLYNRGGYGRGGNDARSSFYRGY